MEREEITLYTQPSCAACEEARAWLAARGVAVRVRDIRADDAALFDFMDTGSRSTPALVAGGRVLEGFTPEAWAEALGVSA